MTLTAKISTGDGAAGELEGLHHSAVVVGGGQAGLSMSYCLTRHGVDHVVLERDRVGHEWRDRRWDSFCLVTPNWQCRLPGFPYAGDDPDGFMGRDEIVRYIKEYAKSFSPPIIEGTAATRLRRDRKGRYLVGTGRGELIADQVVLATGPYQVPLIPRLADRLPDGLTQLHSCDYHSPEQLPPGEVLVVGTGQSGCQIAEDLHLAGRRVHLAVGSAPRVARFYRGRDVVAWLADLGYYRKAVGEFANADAVRFRANHYVTGRDGGRDIDLRAFTRGGMRLYGRLTGVTNTTLRFASDLERNLDNADAVADSIKDSIDSYIDNHGINAPTEPRYTPVWTPERELTQLELRDTGVTSVIWSTGFGRDDRWIEVPVFDGRGYPTHDRGVTSSPGLYFLGLPWQHTWGSGRLSGVADDAAYLTERITTDSDHVFRWIAGTSNSTYPRDDDWVAPRTVA
ncbi:MAG TPA: MSMEG_0569 family flavin-dependent oxidoreductase [Pseudonocardiaceae bacterium]|nr:MSMEG_0569 family flavin-dependent oxidoreductase [Pseudonocardiaceae bacterium]